MPAPRATNGTPARVARADDRLHLLGRLRQHDERRHDPVAGQPVALVGAELLRLLDHGVRGQQALQVAGERHRCQSTAVQADLPAGVELRGERDDADPLRRGARLRRRPPARRSAAAREELLAARTARQAAAARRRDCPTSSRRRARSARSDVAGRRGAARPPGPPRRDHRPDRPEDGDQRAQLGRARLHGRLRGRELADLVEPGRGPAEHDRRASSGRSRSTRARRATG